MKAPRTSPFNTLSSSSKNRRGRWCALIITIVLVQSLLPPERLSQAQDLPSSKAPLLAASTQATSSASYAHANRPADAATALAWQPAPLASGSLTQRLRSVDTTLPGRGGFVVYGENGRSVCRGATPEETRELRKRDPNIPLHALSPISAGVSESAEPTQGGLKIILRATPQLESNPVAKAAFIRAAAAWEAIVLSPITVVIDVDYGPTRFGEPFPAPGIIGSTDPQELAIGNLYPQVRSKLLAGASSEQELSLYNSLPLASVPTDLGATDKIHTPSATLRALGIINPIADPDGELAEFDVPPSIGFNSAMPFDFDPGDGVDPDKIDFDTTAVHEIGHALGFTSLVGERESEPDIPLFVSIWDLFRFRPGTTLSTFPTAPRILSSGGDARFFAGGSELALSTGRMNQTGGDGQQASHWKDDELTGQHIGIMDPTLEHGARYTINANDRAAMNFFGYFLAAEPREAKIAPSDLTGGARLGSGVAISGDTAVVGNPFSPGLSGNNSPGAAYIYVRNADGVWAQQAKLVPSDSQSANRFGNGVAISGDTVVIGAFTDNVGANTDQGSAYIFVRNGTTWTQQAKLIANDGAASDQFGFRVGISGDTVIIGSLRDDVGGVTDKGAAYVFVRNGTAWAQQQKLAASDGAADDLFGVDVAISGDTAVVGAYLDDEGAKQNQGAAYVFVRNGTTWAQQRKLTPADGVGGEGFGYRVAIDKGTAVIGKVTGLPSLGVRILGAAYVFVQNGTTWTQQQKLVAGDGATNTAFGESVAISNNRVVVGAHRDSIDGTLLIAGSAYVFVRKGTIWSAVQKLTATDAERGGEFGDDVAISGDAAIIGASRDGNVGSAYIYSPLLAPPTVQKTGVFRPSTGELFLKNTNSSGFADTHIIFGNPSDYPLAGDWNGDGVASVGIYRNGAFYLRNTNSTGFADIVIPFGIPGDQAIAGDWNGDGTDTVGVYRNGTFLLRNSNTAGPPDLVFTLGDPGDVGIAGDWNGDGIVTCGVFRPSNGIVYLRNSNTTGFADRSFVFGNAGDKPVAGDWNGDGVDTIGIYRDGVFYLSNSNATGFADVVFVLGNSGDFPIAGNWNGQP